MPTYYWPRNPQYSALIHARLLCLVPDHREVLVELGSNYSSNKVFVLCKDSTGEPLCSLSVLHDKTCRPWKRVRHRFRSSAFLSPWMADSFPTPPHRDCCFLAVGNPYYPPMRQLHRCDCQTDHLVKSGCLLGRVAR